MRIALACSRLDRSGGGMERQARDILAGLLDRGVEPLVIARAADSSLPLVERVRRLRRVSVAWVPGKLRDKYFSWRVERLCRREGIETLIACYRMDRGDVVLCGGTHIGFLRATGKVPGLADRLHVDVERRQFRGARIVVACSGMMREELVELYGVVPERVRVLHPAIDGKRFAPLDPDARAALRRDLGLEEDRKYFLFPSGAHERKGLPFLRAYFEASDLPVELLVAGRGARNGRNVRSLGYLENIERHYQAVDATVMASVYEPFGMVGVESVACGTPVVLSRNMGCCEALAAPALFSFAPGDRRGLDRAVRDAVAFDRSGAGDLRRCIAYDADAGAYVDEFLRYVFPGG